MATTWKGMQLGAQGCGTMESFLLLRENLVLLTGSAHYVVGLAPFFQSGPPVMGGYSLNGLVASQVAVVGFP